MRGNMASIKGKRAIYGDLEMTKTRFLNYQRGFKDVIVSMHRNIKENTHTTNEQIGNLRGK